MADQITVIETLGSEIVVIEASGAQAYGLPADGTTGQKIRKKSAAAYDTEWVDDFYPSTQTPAPLGIADAGLEQLAFARADHVHDHGSLGGGGLHANATISQSGFLSAADKQKLDGANAANVANTLVRRDASGGFAAGLINASITGSAAMAAKLEVARLINGVPFDGSADITVVGPASLSAAGIVQLNNSLNSTSVSQAATPSTVNTLRQKLEAFRNSRKIYVSLEGNDANDGTSEGEPLRTIKAAVAMAQPGDVIKIASGDYTEICPLRVPRNVAIWGDSLRNVFIRPTAQTATKGIFKVDSGFLAQGITFAGHQATLNEQAWAISFDELADNSALGASGPGAYIQVSPYIRNCTSYTAAQGNGFAASTSQGITGGGMEIDGAKCAPNSPIRSMVVDSFTQINLNGPGCLVKNNGYAQLVSFFGTFCSYHVRAESGGQVNLSNSTTDFGTYGLMADGYSPNPIFIGEAGSAAFGAPLASFQVTIDVASSSFSATNHGLTAGTKLFFEANQGQLPPQLLPDTPYWVVATGLSANSFKVSNAFNGTALTLSGSADGIYGITVRGDSEIDVINLGASSIGPVSRPQPGMLMLINGAQYVVTGSVPIAGGYRVNFFNNVNGGLFAPISQAEPINFHLRSQIATGGHNMEYVGAGTNYNALPWFGGVPIPANQVVETNGGRVFFSTTDELGNFRVGDAFDVDGTTGAVTINTSQFNLSGLNFIGPFSRNGGLSVVGVQLREISNNTNLIASTGTADGNTVPTQFAVKTYTEGRLAAKVDAVAGSGPITTSAASSGDPAVKTVTVGINEATASASGAMAAADKAKLDAATAANTAGTLVRRDSSGNFSAGTITAALSGNASSANQALRWSAPRTIALSGDVTGLSAGFDGTADLSFATSLSATGVTPGTYRSVSVDAKGRISAGTNPTTLAGYGITDALSASPTSEQNGYFQSVYLKDASNPSHYLQLQVNEDLTAGRLLAISVGNADRQVAFKGNISFGGPVSTTDGQSLAITLTGATAVTLPTSGTLAVVNSPAFTGTPTAPTANVDTSSTQLATTAFVVNQGYLKSQAAASTYAPLASPVLTGTPSAPTASAGTNTTQLATTAFVQAAVDAASQGLTVKQSCQVVTTANITLSGIQTIDGVALVAGNRVLVRSQSNASENGIYVVASGAWSRATDFDEASDVSNGAFTFVESGTLYANSGWVLTVNGSVTLGTTPLTFVQFSGAGQIATGAGLTKSGNTLLVAEGGITSAMLLDGTIVNADISNAAAIADSKLATIASADKVSLSALNIDGATDLGAALADADLFIVDDGGGGTNRKAAATRLSAYVFGKVSGDLTTTSTGVAAIKSSVALTGAPTAPTAAVDTNTTQLATTAFVLAQAASSNPLMDGAVALGSSLRYARADHVHPTDTSRAPLASPALTGTPTAPTAAAGTNTTQLATTAFVRNEVAALVAAAPTTLDTLNELASALGNDPNFATTVSTALGTKYDSTDLASQAQAVAGSATDVLMTPLRTAEAIAALSGPAGNGGDKIFVENDQVVSSSYTVPAGKNASSVGPVAVASGVTVTISENSTWVIL